MFALAGLGLAACVPDFSPDLPGQPADPVGEKLQDARVVDARVLDAGVVREAALPVEATAPTPELERGPCDLSGRWIMTERMLTNALGALQATSQAFYVELSQQGDVLTFSKSLLCGGLTLGLGLTEVRMDDSDSWPAYQRNTHYDGRTGKAVASADGCDVRFDEGVLVRAMTTSVYRDKTVPLPALDEQASGDTPGWEDWDGDGKPGLTMHVSGIAQGRIYTSYRTYANASGTSPEQPTHLTLEHDWYSERAVLAYDPPTAFVLASNADRAPEPGGNIVQLARLADDQATGDDDAKCAAMRELAPTMTPDANKLR